MLRYAVDEVTSDRVVGWAFDPDAMPDVNVYVDGHLAGQATPGVYRADVAIALDDDRAATSGFEFRFEPRHFSRLAGRAHVAVRVGSAQALEVAVPIVPAERGDAAGAGPFPPAVLALLAAYDGAYCDATWTDELSRDAVRDLAFLIDRGPRAVPDLHRYLVLLSQLRLQAQLVERFFPRENPAADVRAKDRSAVQNSGLEVFCVAAHLVTLVAHGVPGPLLEFGCFKGFSTAILSTACRHVGRDMHVFDSFAGLPPSESAYYRAGEFSGTRREVEDNVAVYGSPTVVAYHQGFFADTLPSFSEQTFPCVWMDVDLASSSADVMTILPRLDRRGVVFSHECRPEFFTSEGVRAEPGPDSVVPPILDAFAASGRRVAGMHVGGHTGAFWDVESGLRPLPADALVALCDAAQRPNT